MYVIGSIILSSDPQRYLAAASFRLANPRAGFAGNSFNDRVAALEAIHALGASANAWPAQILETMGFLREGHLRELTYSTET